MPSKPAYIPSGVEETGPQASPDGHSVAVAQGCSGMLTIGRAEHVPAWHAVAKPIPMGPLPPIETEPQQTLPLVVQSAAFLHVNMTLASGRPPDDDDDEEEAPPSSVPVPESAPPEAPDDELLQPAPTARPKSGAAKKIPRTFMR
jgi:hypothetical protein